MKKNNIKKIIFGSLLSISICLGSAVSFAQTKEDYLDKFVGNIYGIIFNREADEEGKNYWINQVLDENIGVLDLLNQILDQPEFEELNISNEEFINKNYELLLNREADQEGFEYWSGILGDNTSKNERLSLINEMAHSEEFMGEINNLGILFKKYKQEPTVEPEKRSDLDEFISDAYTYLLGRDYDYEGFNYWKNQLTSQSKGAIDLINEFIKLDEFKSRNLSDRQFISEIYQVLFNREADSDGLNYWISLYQKDKTSQRMVNIVLNIADNTEFLDRIKGMNIIFKKIDLNLFYSELLTKQNKIRAINSSQLSEIKQGMTFFDIIVKLGRTRNVSNVEGVNVAKYIVDGSKEFYFIFSDPSAIYKFNPMDILNSQN
ncbi:hypothetical protein SFBM_0929 [Candidatus Arthromitus sp. SFB-mouse-Japan]|nr:DUF4214 domain-containing protein [Candidatus Arthromitus sp. SFB-mouse]AID44909.1 Hypothetical protein SFBmNL_01004 [Candidatus Arthromitus sp. SFB-mouse-NL]EGX28624.1 hypothetical protein SFBNYU_006470 [Candidatus Arthromitus sp. SFB-mouse-NYU]EIA26024.1 hypothetical protein SFB4_280G8 [Candidatus Arthromitus sp. SFB-4]EIA27372.1 hypothetical protein SFB6_109G61 [Candidatus Arthromitus sp. SFB-co]EIA30966.1 hypothetical protein SFBSU_006G647 [Candidatus Arthromitus sp. SFB-mouse-SU]